MEDVKILMSGARNLIPGGTSLIGVAFHMESIWGSKMLKSFVLRRKLSKSIICKQNSERILISLIIPLTGHWKATEHFLGNFTWKILYKNQDLKGGCTGAGKGGLPLYTPLQDPDVCVGFSI